MFDKLLDLEMKVGFALIISSKETKELLIRDVLDCLPWGLAWPAEVSVSISACSKSCMSSEYIFSMFLL